MDKQYIQFSMDPLRLGEGHKCMLGKIKRPGFVQYGKEKLSGDLAVFSD